MKKILLCLFITANFCNSIWAQQVKKFPVLSGTTLDNKKVSLPADVAGKYSLIGLAYSKQAEDELQSWFQPVFTSFIEKPKPGLLNDSYDVHLYFIPMFTGLNQAASETATKKMKEGLDKSLIPFVLVYKGELKTYKEQLNLEKNDIPYFFVLDKEGKIVYATSGKYSEDKMEKIEEILDAE